MGDYVPPSTRELELLLQPLPPRARSEQEKAKATIRAEKILLDNARDIAKELVDLALHAQSEKVRLEASKYVLDRVAGRIPLTSQVQDPNDRQPWEDVLGTVFREPSKYELDGTVVDPPPPSNES